MVEVATGGGCDQGEDAYPRPPQLKEQVRPSYLLDVMLSSYILVANYIPRA